MASFLNNPDKDLSFQLAALERAYAGVPTLVANYRELAVWLAAWKALLAQALTEGRLGKVEGEDDARRGFLIIAEQLSNAATRTLARTRVALGPNASLWSWPAFSAHLHAWHALRGVRQGVSWSGRKAETSGRKPILVLSPAGDAHRQSLTADPLLATPLAWTPACALLNQLAEGLRWRG